MIVLAKNEDKNEILALYKTMLYGPADWDEHYPSMETIDFDISRDALFVMKNDDGEIVAAITIDDDPEVEKLTCWNTELAPGAELSRLAVREDVRNQSIARRMMQHTFDILKNKGYKSVHILVRTGHIVAVRSYTKLGFVKVGECELFGRNFICMEVKL